jgi:glycosyltransferase involved in cell wall biosynthesis
MTALTLVVPAFNEEETLPRTMPRLLDAAAVVDRDVQIIIVNNGSTDGTHAAIGTLTAADRRFVGVHTDVKGVGAAMRAAIPHVRGERVITVDADLTTDLSYIDEAVRLLDNGCDVVCGSKIAGRQRRSPVRVAVTALLGWLGRTALGVPEDVSPGAKGYRRDVLQRYQHEIGRGSGYLLNILVAARTTGLRVTSIPVSCDDRRRSRHNLIAEGAYRFGHVAWLLGRRAFGRI